MTDIQTWFWNEHLAMFVLNFAALPTWAVVTVCFGLLLIIVPLFIADFTRPQEGR